MWLMEVEVFIALGSNLGDREELLQKAFRALQGCCSQLQMSGIYESEPQGYDSSNKYLNAVVRGVSSLSAQDLLTATQEIEKDLGRSRSIDGYEDRPMDLDILLYGDQSIDEPNLIVPHPRMHERDFVLVPLLELANPIHPVLNRPISELVRELPNHTTLARRNES